MLPFPKTSSHVFRQSLLAALMRRSAAPRAARQSFVEEHRDAAITNHEGAVPMTSIALANPMAPAPSALRDAANPVRPAPAAETCSDRQRLATAVRDRLHWLRATVPYTR